MNQDWDIKPCSGVCGRCKKHFEDLQLYLSLLVWTEAGYCRADYCDECGRELQTNEAATHGVWRGEYYKPVPLDKDPLKQETAETLLRRLIESGDKSHKNTVYVLAVMLERKRVMVEREIRSEEGGIIIVYEHRKTGEMFLIPDPGLRLDQLGQIQAEVTALLSNSTANAPAAPATTANDVTADPAEGPRKT